MEFIQVQAKITPVTCYGAHVTRQIWPVSLLVVSLSLVITPEPPSMTDLTENQVWKNEILSRVCVCGLEVVQMAYLEQQQILNVILF